MWGLTGSPFVQIKQPLKSMGNSFTTTSKEAPDAGDGAESISPNSSTSTDARQSESSTLAALRSYLYPRSARFFFLSSMGSLTRKNRPTLPLAMASDRSLSSVSPSSRAPPESPCLAMAGAGSSTTIQRLLPIRSARPRERFSDLLTMIDGKSMATLTDETLWVFELRARVLAQQSSLLMELESCFIQGASKLVSDGGDGRAAGVSTEPTAADLPSRVRRSPAL